MKVSYLTGMEVSASGLAAQRAVMNAAAENLANAQTTRTENGEPYRRKVATLKEEPVSFAERVSALEPGEGAAAAGSTTPAVVQRGTAPGVAAEISEDPTPFPEIYDPTHPDADESGMVRMPNVDTAREMVTLMAASRAYEANVAALQASRRLAEASLNLAR